MGRVREEEGPGRTLDGGTPAEPPRPALALPDKPSIAVLPFQNMSGDHEQEYFEFVIGEWVPGVQRLGFQPIDAWATVFGAYPQIQVGLLADNAPKARELMGSRDWDALEERLLGFVKNYSYKVVSARNGFQF